MPVVEVGGHKFVVLLPFMTIVPVTELRRPIGDLTAYRGKIVDALDWMCSSASQRRLQRFWKRRK